MMWISLALFCCAVLATGCAIDERNAKIVALEDLEKERLHTKKLGLIIRELRARAERS